MSLLSLSPLQLYYKPVRPVITIRDKLADPTYLYYDAFNPPDVGSTSPTATHLDVSLSLGGAGTFALDIDDNGRQIDETKIKQGNQVLIDVGREPDSLTRLFSGIIKAKKKIRDNYGILRYQYTGFGRQIIFNERIVNFIRSALPRAGDPTRPFYDDPNMKLYKLVRELCERTDPIPLGWPTIKHTHHDNFLDTTTKISTDADQFIPSVFEPYVEASQAMNGMVSVSGGIWGVDEHNRLFLRYPSTAHSGIIVKNRPDSATEYTDRHVSYLTSDGGFSFEDSTRKEDGFFNRVFSKTGTIARSAGSEATENQTRLAGVDIAQQFTVTSSKLRDLLVKLTAHNSEDVPWYTLSGGGNFGPIICIVDDFQGRPGPNIEFKAQPAWVGRDNQMENYFLPFGPNFRLKNLKTGDKAWLILYGRNWVTFPHPISAPDEPGINDPEKSFGWHHDGGSGGTSAVRTFSSYFNGTGRFTTREPDRNDTTTGWAVNNNGPTYSHVFTDEFSHIIEASDQDSIDEYGLVETFIDASWITDAHTMAALLSSALVDAAKPRRIYDIPRVTIPYGTLFWPGQIITIQDDMSNLNTSAEIQEVRYEWSSQSAGVNPLGINHCEIRPISYVDFRDSYITTPGQLGPLRPLGQEGETDGGLAEPSIVLGGQVDVPLETILQDIAERQGIPVVISEGGQN